MILNRVKQTSKETFYKIASYHYNLIKPKETITKKKLVNEFLLLYIIIISTLYSFSLFWIIQKL